MKIAISATGKDLSSTVDPRFGRAAYLLIVDSDTKTIIEAIDNQAAGEAAQGAGIKAAGLIADAGAGAVLTGVVGPKAAAVCEKAGITMLNNITGTVAEAIDQFRAGEDAPAPGTPSPPRTGSHPAIPCRQKKGKGLGRGCGTGGCRARRGGRGEA
ncbi:MAG: NifB/NifX family molybdenum-iron cluster-binding protein [Desulfobulbia bacterium]